MRSSQLVLAVEQAWFEQPDEEIAELEDAPARARPAWRWLALSLASAAAAIAIIYTI